MPRYYCDYCDMYLTHDSAVGRRQHNYGWKHRENYKLFVIFFSPARSFPQQAKWGGSGGLPRTSRSQHAVLASPPLSFFSLKLPAGYGGKMWERFPSIPLPNLNFSNSPASKLTDEEALLRFRLWGLTLRMLDDLLQVVGLRETHISDTKFGSTRAKI